MKTAREMRDATLAYKRAADEQTRNDKKQATRKMRKINKKICKESLDSGD